ncbi:MAG TPA: hypothetical protein VHG51_09940 [Longimicrobiaceae bacterium]|nr:hypothetical protein [Longimicrobiaceae bacterium]
MTEREKRHAIQEFFCAPKPALHPKTILTGAAIALVGLLILSNGVSLFGLAVTGAGLAWAFFLPLKSRPVPGVPQRSEPTEHFSLFRYTDAKSRFEQRPSTQQILTWFREDIDGVVAASYERVGLMPDGHAGSQEDELGLIAQRVSSSVAEAGLAGAGGTSGRSLTSKKPLVVFGPADSSTFLGFDDSMVRRRRLVEGDAFMYSTWRVIVFHFTEYFLGAYQANYNMIKNVCVMEEVDEFFYRDVVAVKTVMESTNMILESGTKLEHRKVFRMTVSSGDHITVDLGGEGIQVASALEARNDENVQNIRAMLRTFKQANIERGGAGQPLLQ